MTELVQVSFSHYAYAMLDSWPFSHEAPGRPTSTRESLKLTQFSLRHVFSEAYEQVKQTYTL